MENLNELLEKIEEIGFFVQEFDAGMPNGFNTLSSRINTLKKVIKKKDYA